MSPFPEYKDPCYPPSLYFYWPSSETIHQPLPPLNAEAAKALSHGSYSSLKLITPSSKNIFFKCILMAGGIAMATVCLLTLRRILKPITFTRCRPKQAISPEGFPLAPRVLVTGANSGIGKAVVEEVLKRNCPVIMACRDVEAGNVARADILQKIGEKMNYCERLVTVHQLDLTSLDSMESLVEHLRENDIGVHVLINNAGVYPVQFHHVLPTKFEEAMAVNHLGHYYLTRLMLDKGVLRGYATPKQFDINNDSKSTQEETEEWQAPRVVIVSSSLAKKGRLDPCALDYSGHEKYSASAAYANSKLANCLFAMELHRRYNEEVQNDDKDGVQEKVNVYCVNTSGMVNTNLFRHSIKSWNRLLQPVAHLLKWLLKTPAEGCQSVVHCALSSELSNSSGLFYSDCKPSTWPTPYDDMETCQFAARKLWDSSFDTWSSVMSSRASSGDQPTLKW